MMRSRLRRTLTTYGLAVIIGMAIIATTLFGALAVYQGDAERTRNCEEIEILKAQLRPPPFDLADTRELLLDLDVDPDSRQGERLIERGQKNTMKDRALLAPEDC